MGERSKDRVQIENDVVFGTGGGRDLCCDIYRPPRPRADAAGVLLVHGGGWIRGDRSQLRGYGILLGRMGFTCLSAEYRLSGEAKWPAPLHDLKAALRFLRAEAPSLGVDPRRIVVSGNSAGAHLALMLAATQNQASFEGAGGNPDVSTDCAAVVAIYPPTLLVASERRDGHIPPLFERGTPDDVVRAASPLHYAANPDFPPTLLIHGNADRIVPDRASFDMYHALRSAGTPAELHVFDDAPHAFDAAPPLGRQCAQLIELFVDRHVGAAGE